MTKSLVLHSQVTDHYPVYSTHALIEYKNLPIHVLKRVFDIIGSVVLLVVLLPLLIFITVLIRLDSPGKAIYKQTRVGKDGKTFEMYKFRSMQEGADGELAPLMHLNESNDYMFKMKNDPRLTNLGYFLRRHSLDELPQLVNVLKGNMSLIGPRPPLVSEVSEYLPHHFRRLEVLPGMTGLWQVSGRSLITDFEQVVKLDTAYIDNWSLWLDLKILLKTVGEVIRPGAGAA